MQSASREKNAAGLRFFSEPSLPNVKKLPPSGWVGLGFGVFAGAEVGGWVGGLGFCEGE